MSNEDKKDTYHENLATAIENTRGTFVELIAKFELRHKTFRRLGSIASFVFLFGLMASTIHFNKFLGIQLTEISTPIFDNSISENVSYYIVMNIVLLFFIMLSIFVPLNPQVNCYKGIKGIIYIVIVSYGALNLLAALFYDWKIISTYFVTFGSLIFVICYSTNRKYGYTRGWSRNRVYLTQLDILICEKDQGLISDKTEADGGITSVDKETRKKLHSIILQAKVEAHKDIVNDYIEYGNSAISWLSKNKTKK